MDFLRGQTSRPSKFATFFEFKTLPIREKGNVIHWLICH